MNSNWVTVFIFSIVIFYYNRAAAVLNNANDNTNRGYPGLYNVVWHKTISKKKTFQKLSVALYQSYLPYIRK